MRMFITLALLLANIMCVPLFAADEDGRFGIRGAGLLPCQHYLVERQQRSEVYRLVAGWIDGYITATNQHMTGTFDVASFESTELLTALLNEHCKANPDKVLFAVLEPLVVQLNKNRIASAQTKVQIAVGERSISVYPIVLKRIQQTLRESGFYQGQPTGHWDSDTQAALGLYQSSIDLEATGFPDQLTLWKLFVES